jgi:5-hydroxyisourate hydrolase
MGLSTHILDTALGKPVAGVHIHLERRSHDGWTSVGEGITDADGRCGGLLGDELLKPIPYRLTFITAAYFKSQGITSLHPLVVIHFTVANATEHYHIPLLLTANGYTTYRGS